MQKPLKLFNPSLNTSLLLCHFTDSPLELATHIMVGGYYLGGIRLAPENGLLRLATHLRGRSNASLGGVTLLEHLA